MLEVVAAPPTDEARIAHVSFSHPLPVSQLGERVDDDTEDDVQTDGGDEDEEGEMVDDEQPEPGEGVLWLVVCDVLYGKQNPVWKFMLPFKASDPPHHKTKHKIQ